MLATVINAVMISPSTLEPGFLDSVKIKVEGNVKSKLRETGTLHIAT